MQKRLIFPAAILLLILVSGCLEPPKPVEKCGDGNCTESENWKLCPADCPQPLFCGDNTCSETENWKTCPKDCEKPAKPVCGDRVCEPKEQTICPKDCPTVSNCGDSICDAKEKANPAQCPVDCAQIETHTECQNQLCATVDGAGAGECASDSDCTTQPQTHMACQNQQCVTVNGAGANQCTSNSDCTQPTHTECQNQQCTTVSGTGTNECTTNPDCAVATHSECQNGQCTQVEGAGIDQCTSNADCTVEGETYYVSKQGSNNDDGSEQNPWLTIQKAADSVNPGDIVYVKEGIYRESVTITKSGTQEKRIIFSNFQNDKANILVTGGCHGFYVEADYVTIRGFNITDAYFEDAGCPDWTASGITTHRSNNIFENNEISNSMYGILMRANIGDDYSGELQLPTEGSNMVRNNYIHNTDYGAIRVKRSNHNIVKDNKFYYNNQKLSSFNDKEGNILTYLDAPLTFYCLEGLTIENNEFIEPKFGPVILELDMVTRTAKAPSMAPNPNDTKCPLYLSNVIIRNNTADKTENQEYPIILTFGRDFALGSGHVINDNVWFNGNPGSKIIEWGYNFWHDNDADDGIDPKIWTLSEFQENTGYDISSEDTNPVE